MKLSAPDSPQSQRLLVVCTGNLARSVMGQFLLSARLAQSNIGVSSAGTDALDGLPMAEHANEVLQEVGVVPGYFSSRRLTPQMVEQADLVLTASREHRGVVLRDVPRAMRKTFTLRELAHLVEAAGLGQAPAASPAELATSAASVRGQVHLTGEDYDIADPYGHDLDTFRACRDTILEAVESIVPALHEGRT